MSNRSTKTEVPQALKTGSPQSGEPFYLAIGKLRRTHGVHGELVLDVLTDFPQRFKVGAEVWIGERHSLQTVASFRPAGNNALVAFKGFEDCETAAIFRNQWVYGRQEDAPELNEGQFFVHEILGMQVVDESGQNLGKVTEIIETGANDVYVVTDEKGKEELLPAIKSVVVTIDKQKKVIIVRPPEWD
jgi:16S rRNA processing protein RimM